MQGKITKRAIDGLAATGGAEAFLWDTEVKGFGGRARKGGGKSYILHYRIGGGRAAALRKLTIGKHGSPWTPETARGEAKRLLGEVAVGRDPAKARQADRKALTFNELIDLYLAEGVSHKKASTLRVDRGRFEHHLRPLLGKLRIDRITRADVERMRDAVAAGKTAGKIEPGEKRRSGTLAKGGKGRRAMRDIGQRDLFVCDRARPLHCQPGARRQEGTCAEDRALSVRGGNRPAGGCARRRGKADR